MTEVTAFTGREGLDADADAWLGWLRASPEDAMAALLAGQVWLGGYANAGLPQAVPQFLPEPSASDVDRGLQAWLTRRWRTPEPPADLTPRAHAKALADAFGLLQTLDLPLTRAWYRERALALWAWLATQPRFAAADARPLFLRALALQQPNRDLLDFWLNLCQQAHERWAPMALFGLRRMPIDDAGTLPSGLPTVLIGGLIDYGITLSQRGQPFKKRWLEELDFLTAVYPMSAQRWAEQFRVALQPRPAAAVERLRHWLDERHPAANKAPPPHARQRTLAPPHWRDQIQPQIDLLSSAPERALPALRALMAQHVHYARESGDAHYLVVSNCRLANHLLEAPAHAPKQPRDAAWALDLAHVATHWAPGNHRCWSVLARALDTLGDWPRALATFWFARRRFPYIPQAHNQLGHALMARQFFAAGEAVYREAIRRFPDDPVCWTDLGNTLRAAGRLDEAMEVYLSAQRQPRFSHYPPIYNALADI